MEQFFGRECTLILSKKFEFSDYLKIYFILQFQALYNDAKEYGMNIDYPIRGPGLCTKIPCGIDKLETELKSFKKNNPNLQVVMRFHELF